MIQTTVWQALFMFITIAFLSSVESHDSFHVAQGAPPSLSLTVRDDAGFVDETSAIPSAPDLPSRCRLRFEHDKLPTVVKGSQPENSHSSINKPRGEVMHPWMKLSPKNKLKSIGKTLRRVLAGSPWALQLVKLGARLVPSLGMVLTGLSKLMLPLYLARRAYKHLSLVAQDYITGRYLRTTFERMHKQYRTQYRIPECSRSIGRLAVHLVVLFCLGRVMEWLIGISHAPCTAKNYGGCQLWCACLWMVSVVSSGHAAGVAVAVWSPLQIRVDTGFPRRPSGRRIFTRPWVFVRWILDPDKWFREIIARDQHSLKPFNPEAMMFPSTWSALRIMCLLAVAIKMRGDHMHTFMRRALIHQALSDEWYRVLMCEKRVAWAIFIVAWLFISTMWLSYDVLQQTPLNNVPILLTVPSVLAVIVSSWMNVLVYFDRRQKMVASHGQTN